MKIIAFFLPQYHEIPENNTWWGKGFTEWTNTKKAKPLFKNHYQPREPLNDNYYNLLNNDVKKWQIELAKCYGLYGFCFYHYWFKDGKKLLEKPIEQYLEDKSLDFPFCLSWANEPWSRRWDGSEHKVLMPQEYGEENDWEKHFNYLLPFFKDERYIKIDQKPILIIYKPEIIPCLNEMIDFWQNMARESGLDGIYFGYQFPEFHLLDNKDDSRFQMAIEFEPIFTMARGAKGKSNKDKMMDAFKLLKGGLHGRQAFQNRIRRMANSIIDKSVLKKVSFRFEARAQFTYDELVSKSITQRPLSDKSVAGVFTDWDNTPRRGKSATLFVGSTPNKFKKYLSAQIKRSAKLYAKDMIFINAWNEWAEGAYLEPDKKNGYAYLEAVKEALEENGIEVRSR